MADTLFVLDAASQSVGDMLLTGATVPAAWHLGLIKSGVAVDSTTNPATITGNECDFDGYARVAVGAWSYIGAPGGRHTWTSDAILWALMAAPAVGNTVGGYFLYDDTNGRVFLAANFADGDQPMNAAGQAISVVPTVQVKSINV